MAVLRELRHIARDVAVWATWVVLTLRLSHGRTYGDLRRLGPVELVAHVAPIAIIGGLAAHLYVNMPPEFTWVLAAGGSIGLFTGGALLVVTVVVSRLVDLSFTYR